MTTARSLFAALAVSASLVAPLGAQERVPLAPNSDELHWEAWFDAGVAQLQRRPLVALEAFRHASKLDPTRAEPLYGQYVAFWMATSWEDWVAWWFDNDERMASRPGVRGADSVYTLAMQRNPFVHTGMSIALVERRAQGNYRRSPDTQAWVAYSNGNFAESVRLYQIWLQRDKESKLGDVRDLAISRVGVGDLAGAVADLRYIVDVMNRSTDTAREVRYYRSKEALLYSIGLIEMQRRDLAAARVAFGEATVENAGFAFAHAGLAQVERAERKMPAALAAMAQAVELAPNDGVLRHQYAMMLLESGRFEPAAREADIVIQANPLWAAPIHTLARARERQLRTADANAFYREYVAKAPKNDPQARAVRTRLGLP